MTAPVAHRGPQRPASLAAQVDTPLADALLEYAGRGVTALHTPAHKQGRAALGALRQLVGGRFLRVDQPSLYALDNTFHPHGCIAQAEALAADFWGSEHCFLLAAGSSTAVKGALLAVARDGDAVIVGRDAHKSVHAGLVLAGALPVFPPTTVHSDAGTLPLTAGDVLSALELAPHARAVLLTRPSYYGLLGDLGPIVALCRERGLVLIVDEAHGAHLPLLPGPRPRTALEAGADLVIQSPHKTLGALVGGAQLHVRRGCPVPVEAVRRSLNLLRSTSPSYPVLASLDLARAWAATDGFAAFADAASQAAALRAELRAIEGIDVIGAELPRGCFVDPMRLVVGVANRGTDGWAVERHLRARGLEAEFADARTVGFVLGPRDGPVLERVARGLRTIGEPGPVSPPRLVHVPSTVPRMAPRIASRALACTVPAASAVGRIAAEPVTAYPPGIPLVCAGETITITALRRCEELRALGAVVYASDPSLHTLQCVDER